MLREKRQNAFCLYATGRLSLFILLLSEPGGAVRLFDLESHSTRVRKVVGLEQNADVMFPVTCR